MVRYRCLLLGPPQIESHGQTAQITLQKGIALVAYLAVEQKAFSREYLAALLWPDIEKKHALGNLRGILARLRSTIGAGCIIAECDQVELNRQLIDVDVNEFHSLLSSESSDPDLDRLEKAAGLYRGSFLEGFNLGNCAEFDEWQDGVRERLRLEYYELLETLIRDYLAEGCPELALPFALRWLELDRLNEAAHRALMEIYALTGHADLARRQFESCTKLLAQEAIEPEDRTFELYDAIVKGRYAPPAESAGISPINRVNTPTKTKIARLGRFRKYISFAIAALVAISAIANGIWYRDLYLTDKDIKVKVRYLGQDRLDKNNPIKVFIGPYDQAIDVYDSTWTQFTIASERVYRLPLDENLVYANYRSAHYMFFIHDIGNNLVGLDLDPVDVAGIYKDGVSGNVVYGAFKLSTGSPVFGKLKYRIEFSLPPLPAADAFEVDDASDVATFIDHNYLPVRQNHTFHDEGNGILDNDWFPIALQAGDSLVVETFSAGDKWESNTQIDIADSKMNYIGSNRDKTPEDCYSKLEYVNTTGVGQVFHILVKPVNVGNDIQYSNVGRYKVEFRRL